MKIDDTEKAVKRHTEVKSLKKAARCHRRSWSCEQD